MKNVYVTISTEKPAFPGRSLDDPYGRAPIQPGSYITALCEDDRVEFLRLAADRLILSWTERSGSAGRGA